jgi:hypothetical protein
MVDSSTSMDADGRADVGAVEPAVCEATPPIDIDLPERIETATFGFG